MHHVHHHLKQLAVILVAIGIGIALVLPTHTAQALGGSFGGRIAILTPCISALGPSIWVQLAPPAGPLLPPYEYIWTPETLLNMVPPTPSIPPTHPLQEIMGNFDIPFFCFIPSVPPVFLYGLRMQFENVSPV